MAAPSKPYQPPLLTPPPPPAWPHGSPGWQRQGSSSPRDLVAHQQQASGSPPAWAAWSLAGNPLQLLAAPAGVRLARGGCGRSPSPPPVPSSKLDSGGGVGLGRQIWVLGGQIRCPHGRIRSSGGWIQHSLQGLATVVNGQGRGVSTGALLPVLTSPRQGVTYTGWARV